MVNFNRYTWDHSPVSHLGHSTFSLHVLTDEGLGPEQCCGLTMECMCPWWRCWQYTERIWTPSPHVVLHSSHSPVCHLEGVIIWVMNLCPDVMNTILWALRIPAIHEAQKLQTAVLYILLNISITRPSFKNLRGVFFFFFFFDKGFIDVKSVLTF